MGSLTTLRHDHIACIDDTTCLGIKIINDHTALNREPVPLSLVSQRYTRDKIASFFLLHSH